MRPFRPHLRFIAAVLLLSYVVCHVGEGALNALHAVSHQLDAAWDYYVAGNTHHSPGHAHAHAHTHSHGAPHRHSFSGLRQRAYLSTRDSHTHSHPLLSALAQVQEQPEGTGGAPADERDARYEKTKKASEKHEPVARLRWDDACYAGARPRVPPADQRCPTPPTLGTIVPPPEV